jgi:putative intracellular protease/amidase
VLAAIVVVDGVLRDEYDAFRSVLERLPGVHVDTVGARTGPCHGPGGAVEVTRAFPDAAVADVLLVPGSLGCRRAADDPAVRDVLRRLGATSRFVVASSTGSILLAAAGLAGAAPVATHWLAGELISRYGGVASHDRLVATGNVITSSGALTALEAALLLADRVDGDGTGARIRAELLAGGEHHLRRGPWWRRSIGRHASRSARTRPGRSLVGDTAPPATPLSVMIELVDDPRTVDRLRRNAAARSRRR